MPSNIARGDKSGTVGTQYSGKRSSFDLEDNAFSEEDADVGYDFSSEVIRAELEKTLSSVHDEALPTDRSSAVSVTRVGHTPHGSVPNVDTSVGSNDLAVASSSS